MDIFWILDPHNNRCGSATLLVTFHRARAVDPHSFFADPDPEPAVFLGADPDPDPGGKIKADPCGSGSSLTNFVKNELMESFLLL